MLLRSAKKRRLATISSNRKRNKQEAQVLLTAYERAHSQVRSNCRAAAALRQADAKYYALCVQRNGLVPQGWKWPVETKQEALACWMQLNSISCLRRNLVDSMQHVLDVRDAKDGCLASVRLGRDPASHTSTEAAPTEAAATDMLRRLIFWSVIGSCIEKLRLARLADVVNYFSNNMTADDWTTIDAELLRIERSGIGDDDNDLVAYDMVTIPSSAWPYSVAAALLRVHGDEDLEEKLFRCDFKTLFTAMQSCVFGRPFAMERSVFDVWTRHGKETTTMYDLFDVIKVAWLKEWALGLYVQLIATCCKEKMGSMVLNACESYRVRPPGSWHQHGACDILNKTRALRAKVKCRLEPPAAYSFRPVVHVDLSDFVFTHNAIISPAEPPTADFRPHTRIEVACCRRGYPISAVPWEEVEEEATGLVYGPLQCKRMYLRLHTGMLCVARWLCEHGIIMDLTDLVLAYATARDFYDWYTFDHEND
jgi:hypothetical protein